MCRHSLIIRTHVTVSSYFFVKSKAASSNSVKVGLRGISQRFFVNSPFMGNNIRRRYGIMAVSSNEEAFMDMQKIGCFLAELRKAKNLTQEELGEQIGVTNKTVSRYENGNYLPPVEILQMLSKLYDVSINELLSGKCLDDGQYKENAEEFIVADLIKKRKDAKKRLTLSVISAIASILSGLVIILMGALLAAPVWLRISCIAFSAVIIALGVAVSCALTVDAGVYECPNCGEKFVPSIKEFICGAKTFTKRKLKCPKCGKKSYCKKKLG